MPLRAAVYASGPPSPVLELKATDISLRPGRRRQPRDPRSRPARRSSTSSPSAGAGSRGTGDAADVTGLARPPGASTSRSPRPRRSSGCLARRSGSSTVDGTKGALVTYGKGLGGIAVVEVPAEAKHSPARSARRGAGSSLPKISINGALGPGARHRARHRRRFDRGGVSLHRRSARCRRRRPRPRRGRCDDVARRRPSRSAAWSSATASSSRSTTSTSPSRRGDVFGYLGPNGAGKTTSLRMMLGLIRPTEGSVRLFGRDPQAGVAALEGVAGFVEAPRFYPYLNGRAQPRAVRRARRRRRRRAHRRGARRRRAARPREGQVGGYSHGMRQRLGIAAALLRTAAAAAARRARDRPRPRGHARHARC